MGGSLGRGDALARVQDRIGRQLRPVSVSRAWLQENAPLSDALSCYRNACACGDTTKIVSAIHAVQGAMQSSSARYREWSEYVAYGRDASAGGAGAPLVYTRCAEVNRYNGRANADCPLPIAIGTWGRALTTGNATDNAENSVALGAAPTLVISSPLDAGESALLAFGLLMQFSVGADQAANNLQAVVSYQPWYDGPQHEIERNTALSLARTINLKLPPGGSAVVVLFSELIGAAATLGATQGTAREMPVLASLARAQAAGAPPPPLGVDLRQISIAFSGDPTASQVRAVALTRGNADAEEIFLHVIGPRTTVMVPA